MHSPGPHLEPSDHLSARVKQVLIYAAAGLTNRQIADRLFVSRRSVDRDVKEACEALEMPTRTAVVLEAYRVGVIRDDHLSELR
ncbi:helix-turn-helix domain-containing protein [Glycomyces salinus]|uniref:helix-turn-helix domain-containing protein n=1 Tax=Glycomyces salinus TaxID=980294 RepID=UPI0018EC33F8|nr:helix-turn-helix transcriptional regulator [Glycomyces salinus]